MRILFLTNYASPYRVDFFNELGKSVDLTVLFTQSIKDQKHRNSEWFNENYENFQGITLHESKKVFGKNIYVDVKKWLKQKWDMIFICGYTDLTNVYAIEYLKFHKIPYCMEIDGGIVKKDSWKVGSIKKHLLGHADWYMGTGICASEYLTHYGAKKDRIFNYKLTTLFSEDIKPLPSLEERMYLKAKLNIKEEKVIISVGQFIYRKGFDVLLNACKELDSNIGIYIIGGEPTQEYVKMKEEYNLSNVHFVGFQTKDSLKEYYRSADLFVFPTREDIWGLVIIEAMAEGLPVITTDGCVAGKELIRNGENGYIVPVGDAKELSEKIKLGLNKKEELRENSYLLASNLTIEQMVEDHLHFVKEINKT